MQQGKAVVLDETIALSAAKISDLHKIPMADSIILATAKAYNAVVWTQDSDFVGLNDVQFFEKQ